MVGVACGCGGGAAWALGCGRSGVGGGGATDLGCGQHLLLLLLLLLTLASFARVAVIEDNFDTFLDALPETVFTGKQEHELGRRELEEHPGDLGGQTGTESHYPGVETLAHLLLVVGEVVVAALACEKGFRDKLVKRQTM